MSWLYSACEPEARAWVGGGGVPWEPLQWQGACGGSTLGMLAKLACRLACLRSRNPAVGRLVLPCIGVRHMMQQDRQALRRPARTFAHPARDGSSLEGTGAARADRRRRYRDALSLDAAERGW
jgi:hypothetical protein